MNFVFVTTFDLKAILSDISIATPTLLWLTSAWNFTPAPSPSFYVKPVYVLKSKMNLLYTVYS